MRILLLEDDVPLGHSLHRVLGERGHVAVWLRSAEEARSRIRSEAFDLLLLDIVLPDGSGLDLLHEARARGIAMPIMMLTARDAVSDRVAGLDGGADDYLPKPFAVEELLSRIRVLQRRGRMQLSACWSIGDLSIDTARRRVTVGASEVALSTREYEILLALAADPGRVMTRRQIERSVRVVESNDSNAVDVHVYHLRRKLGPGRIGTVRGVGYVLESP